MTSLAGTCDMKPLRATVSPPCRQEAHQLWVLHKAAGKQIDIKAFGTGDGDIKGNRRLLYTVPIYQYARWSRDLSATQGQSASVPVQAEPETPYKELQNGSLASHLQEWRDSLVLPNHLSSDPRQPTLRFVHLRSAGLQCSCFMGFHSL